MKTSIEQKATLAALTKKEKVALDFIIKNLSSACFMTANEIGRQLGIGASSVVRLSAKLGFDSYTAMRKELQNEIPGVKSKPRELVPHERMRNNSHLSDREILDAYNLKVIQHIKMDMNQAAEAKISAIADAVLKAERVFIVGFRACAGLASTFTTMLTCSRANVFQVGLQQPLVDQMMGLGNKDLLIAISCRRYSKDTFFAAQMAKDMKARIVVMTDSFTAPLAEYADIVQISTVGNFSFFNDYTSLVMNMEKVVLLVGHRSQKDTQKRLKSMEHYLDKTNQY